MLIDNKIEDIQNNINFFILFIFVIILFIIIFIIFDIDIYLFL